MRRYSIITGVATVLAMLAAGSAVAQEYKARLNGFFEVGALTNSTASLPNHTGAILTPGVGRLTLDIDPSHKTASYTLAYSGLTSPITQAHLHFGKVHVAGGIYAFLCTNLGNGPAGTPACPNLPDGNGTVSGIITAASIVGVASQNITAGDFNALLAAVGSDTTYANIHTSKFPAGEIRGQVQHADDDEDEPRGRDR